MKHEPSRRAVVACLTLGLVPFRALAQIAQLCPNDPILTSGKTPLTIDTHAHFFNGRDLQIKEFLSKTTVRKGSELYPLVNAMGSIMQALGWHAAPDATSELDAIASYAKLIKGCDGEGQIREATRPSFREGYLKGRRELQDASKRIAIAAGAAVLGLDTGATPLKAAIEDLPETFDEFEVRRSSGATVLGSNPTFLGYLQFVLHHFNYRHINAIDYLTTYSKDSARKIDLVVPSWWTMTGGSRAVGRRRLRCLSRSQSWPGFPSCWAGVCTALCRSVRIVRRKQVSPTLTAIRFDL